MTPLRILVIGNAAATAGLQSLPEGDSFLVETAATVEEALANPISADVVVLDRSRLATKADLVQQLVKTVAPVPVVVLGDDESFARKLFMAADRARLNTSLAAALEELEAQRAAVLQISQLKHDLVATLAHDIKGPLTSIIGFAELMEEGFLQGEEATDAARTIRTNAQRLATLANDMLALSRVEYGELEIADDRVDVITVLRSAIEAVEAERKIETAFEIDNAFVRGDADRLRQVFDNLLRNAIKYSPGGEPVRVEARVRGDAAVFSFRDRGIGVPPDELPKLFNRFARASNARKLKIAGTGVGLFIARTIVDRHGGGVEAASELSKGSTFTVTLPTLETGNAGPGRVTIVTPDTRLARFTAFELRSRGLRVREVSSASEAASGARGGDVLLVDAQHAAVDQIRTVLGNVRARLIGVGAATGDGWDATLPKPFLVSDLLAAVNVPSRS
ncbi:MAG TPA: HAMP domain-containing sensor histidine kinase [Candidatus Baltobacteraceae bacterium]|nr:HAMP domain-containing sensor histidine kinase [Candidatus Baltobacteraceae bacterium]